MVAFLRRLIVAKYLCLHVLKWVERKPVVLQRFCVESFSMTILSLSDGPRKDYNRTGFLTV
jgi:hypothetical protein